MSVKKFIQNWSGRGYEKGETQKFWLAFLRDVFNISEPEKIIEFEVPVKLAHTSFIDAFLPDTKVIIEQKSLSEDLTQEKTQSDGSVLTPYQQAQRYGTGLPYSMRPRWIIVSNFKEFLIYDMETLAEPKKILLAELPEKFHTFDFLIDANKTKLRLELELSLQAGEIVAKFYDALRQQYLNPNSAESLQSLNKLCVRLVFCLYAESAGIFGKHKIFRDYLQKENNIRRALFDLFDVLNTPTADRDPYLADELKIFPYVNGGLFADKNIEIPNFTPEIKNLLLEEASAGFNWSGISPTIFGAVFESTLNPATRREGGMHYTSIENIHKVIDNLFLNDLRDEFNSCKKNRKKLLAFQDKLSQLKFFDPACGSGNFLTESFISLRRLENDILKEILGEKILLGDVSNPVKVSINQFFGIEINDFAVSVAQTALWIAELQMAQETSEIIHRQLDFLPLKNFANIFKGNALTLDWQKICPQPDFIFGNPPFVGHQWRTPTQVEDMKLAFHDLDKHGKLDYVCAWFNKAADFIKDTKIECAFVSTNSITQGESIHALWKFLCKKIFINFAFRTFKWDSESTAKAHVHCVIIGFATFNRDKKFIFDGDNKIPAENINPYLIDAPNIFIENRGNPPKNFPKMTKGSQPTDGGNLILSEDEKNILLKNFPDAKKFIRPFIGAEEFLHNKKRFCLWLVDTQPSDIKKIPPIFDRIKKVADFRKNSKRKQTLKAAETPQLFSEIRQPTEKFLVAPKVSSELRKYVPMDFLSPDIIVADSLQTIQGADLKLFGILQSSVHMAWTNFCCGRLETRINYSARIVYNNFPFPDKNLEKISDTAKLILQVRKNYPDSSLADLYDPTLMPKDLRDAHKKNDRAVLDAYGFDFNLSEPEIVAELLKLYQNLK